MARYAISAEGAAAMRALAKQLYTEANAILEASAALEAKVSAVGDGLGIYETEILGLIQQVKNALKTNRDDILNLAQRVLQKADEIEALVGIIPLDLGLFGKNHRAKTGASSTNLDRDRLWNETYMPLVQANIRKSVEQHFSQFISPEKLEASLQALSFMDQRELAKRYGKGFKANTLGFNNGDTSNVAHDIKGTTSESGDTLINFAFITAVHENLHMMSANDSEGITRRGIMISEKHRAMNEAITEYFTFLSVGGNTPLGGLYPGEYSSYTTLMKEIPKIEAAVGSDMLKAAYFFNNPRLLETKIDSICGVGAWESLCEDFYIFQYGGGNQGEAIGRILRTLQKLA